MATEKENVNQEKILKEFVQTTEIPTVIPSTTQQIGPKITEIPGTKLPWEKDLTLGNQLGWITLPIQDLPTRGLFYPTEAVVAIRAANGGEIRHWSTLQEDPNDPNYFSNLDDMLNYIIERCVTIKASDDKNVHLSWKDLKEVDRFYLLLAIHELTFPEGENKLQVKITDTKKVNVKKDMVSYVSLDPKLMQYYDEVERCFVLKFKGGKILKLDLPSVGVTQWIKNFIIRKRNSQEYIDEDYLSFAPFIIRSWRGLTEDFYLKCVEDSQKWDITTISLLVHVKKLFADTINPVIKFTDEGGMEQTAPLNFQGGIKSIFLISDPFEQLE